MPPQTMPQDAASPASDSAHGWTARLGDAAHAGDCDHALAQKARAPDAMADAEARCAQAGARLTPLRRKVLAALYGTHRPLGAYDLIERLAAPDERRLAPVSIYRALDFLQARGLAHRIESLNAFVACASPHPEADPVAILMCEVCGGVDEAMSDDLTAALATLIRRKGYSATRRIVEVSGRCGHCGGA